MIRMHISVFFCPLTNWWIMHFISTCKYFYRLSSYLLPTLKYDKSMCCFSIRNALLVNQTGARSIHHCTDKAFSVWSHSHKQSSPLTITHIDIYTHRHMSLMYKQSIHTHTKECMQIKVMIIYTYGLRHTHMSMCTSRKEKITVSHKALLRFLMWNIYF